MFDLCTGPKNRGYYNIKRLLDDKRFDISCIEYDGAMDNVFRRLVDIPEKKIEILSAQALNIKRYFNVRGSLNCPYIFHSSHYRIDKCKNARNVTTVHDFVYEYFVKGIRQKIHSFQKWNSIRKADVVICISESTKKDLLHFLPDIDDRKLVVIHNGVDEGYRKLPLNEYQLNLPFETGEYLVYVGNRHTPYKNFKLAAQSCAKINRPLIIVGGEPVSEQEAIYLNELIGIGRYAYMRGVNNRDLNEIYNRAFALLYPSLYEGFGIPIIEAQRAGIPVVCMHTSSIPEVMGKSDLCIKENFTVDAVCECLKNLEYTEFRCKEINRGYLNTQRFSWNKTYNLTTDVYNSLLE